LDTYGAAPSLPAYFRVIGDVTMGAEANFSLNMGEAARIYTGGMLPQNADAVVMIERTQTINTDQLEVLAPVAVGENVVQIGEDVQCSDPVLPVGTRLRPVDIGALLSAGALTVDVILPPRVGILSSGDEIVPPHVSPQIGQIRDINTAALAGLVNQSGGDPIPLGISSDDYSDLLAKAQAGLDSCDMLIITAGSSISTRDLTAEVIQALGSPGILQHGLAVKPGKPTLIGVCDGKPVIGLPGNPASAYLVARQILVPIIAHWFGEIPPLKTTILAILTHDIPSASGREDTIPVKLIRGESGWQAEPIFGKSNLIFTLARADGVITIPSQSAGLRAESTVEVTPL
jgi:molybdopterin molybdotransferase